MSQDSKTIKKNKPLTPSSSRQSIMDNIESVIPIPDIARIIYDYDFTPLNKAQCVQELKQYRKSFDREWWKPKLHWYSNYILADVEEGISKGKTTIPAAIQELEQQAVRQRKTTSPNVSMLFWGVMFGCLPLAVGSGLTSLTNGGDFQAFFNNVDEGGWLAIYFNALPLLVIFSVIYWWTFNNIAPRWLPDVSSMMSYSQEQRLLRGAIDILQNSEDFLNYNENSQFFRERLVALHGLRDRYPFDRKRIDAAILTLELLVSDLDKYNSTYILDKIIPSHLFELNLKVAARRELAPLTFAFYSILLASGIASAVGAGVFAIKGEGGAAFFQKGYNHVCDNPLSLMAVWVLLFGALVIGAQFASVHRRPPRWDPSFLYDPWSDQKEYQQIVMECITHLHTMANQAAETVQNNNNAAGL